MKAFTLECPGRCEPGIAVQGGAIVMGVRPMDHKPQLIQLDPRAVVRDGKLQNLDLTLPESSGEESDAPLPFASLAITDARVDLDVAPAIVAPAHTQRDVHIYPPRPGAAREARRDLLLGDRLELRSGGVGRVARRTSAVPRDQGRVGGDGRGEAHARLRTAWTKVPTASGGVVGNKPWPRL